MARRPATDRDGDRAETTSSANERDRQFNVALAYLRAFLIVLVVAHHAAQGYNVILPPADASSLAEHLGSMRAISPVIDEQRSGMLSLFSAFNDTFFMSLLFLLSGLFLWSSLQSKGSAVFLRDRLLRLGVPLAAMAILRPLTYYPTYLQTGGGAGLADFWGQWSAIEWRGGPIWFLELLLLFDVAVVIAAALTRRASGTFNGMRADLFARPVKVLVLLVLLSVLAYIPISLAYGSFYWLQVGPAQLQVNRVLLYGLYFLLGVFFGASGIERTFLVPNSSLARRWGVWTVAALATFSVFIALAMGGASEALAGFFYVLSSATLSFSFLALFLRFFQRRTRVFDSVFENSYGIYVIHYGVVSWLLFAFVDVQLAAITKWAIVFPLAVAIGWGTTEAIRRIPGVARVL